MLDTPDCAELLSTMLAQYQRGLSHDLLTIRGF